MVYFTLARTEQLSISAAFSPGYGQNMVIMLRDSDQEDSHGLRTLVTSSSAY